MRCPVRCSGGGVRIGGSHKRQARARRRWTAPCDVLHAFGHHGCAVPPVCSHADIRAGMPTIAPSAIQSDGAVQTALGRDHPPLHGARASRCMRRWTADGGGEGRHPTTPERETSDSGVAHAHRIRDGHARPDVLRGDHPPAVRRRTRVPTAHHEDSDEDVFTAPALAMHQNHPPRAARGWRIAVQCVIRAPTFRHHLRSSRRWTRNAMRPSQRAASGRDGRCTSSHRSIPPAPKGAAVVVVERMRRTTDLKPLDRHAGIRIDAVAPSIHGALPTRIAGDVAAA